MPNATVVRMPKRFDYTSSAEFNGAVAIAMEQSNVITLDCSDLDYIDSAGIGLLVMSQKKAQSRQTKLVMINLKAAPREILGLANLQKIIEIK